MDLFDLLYHVKTSEDTTQYHIGSDWGQGRTVFGGVLSSMVYVAMRRYVDGSRELLSLTTTFVRPLLQDSAFEIEITPLREGKAVSQLSGQVVQNGEVVLSVLGCFGQPRESKVRVAGLPAPVVSMPNELPVLPMVAGMVPQFTEHFDYRWLFGGLPFSGTDGRDMGGWWRLTDARHEGEAAFADAFLVALIDAWPPAVLPLLDTFAPASTMTWTIAFAQPMPSFECSDWLLYRSHVDAAAAGYAHTSAHIWNQAGELLALSTQTVGVFDA